jgi:hypothetical protein
MSGLAFFHVLLPDHDLRLLFAKCQGNLFKYTSLSIPPLRAENQYDILCYRERREVNYTSSTNLVCVLIVAGATASCTFHFSVAA